MIFVMAQTLNDTLWNVCHWIKWIFGILMMWEMIRVFILNLFIFGLMIYFWWIAMRSFWSMLKGRQKKIRESLKHPFWACSDLNEYTYTLTSPNFEYWIKFYDVLITLGNKDKLEKNYQHNYCSLLNLLLGHLIFVHCCP